MRKDLAQVVVTIIFLWALAFVIGYLSGCKPLLSATELLARKVSCALAHRNMTNEEILLKCAVDEKDAKNILDIVGQEREHDARLRAGACK